MLSFLGYLHSNIIHGLHLGISFLINLYIANLSHEISGMIDWSFAQGLEFWEKNSTRDHFQCLHFWKGKWDSFEMQNRTTITSYTFRQKRCCLWICFSYSLKLLPYFPSACGTWPNICSDIYVVIPPRGSSI